MKSAYELAMERLQKNQPNVALNEDQKKQLAEIDSMFKAKIAERELFLKEQIAKAHAAGKIEDALAEPFHSRPVHFRPEMMLGVIAVVEKQPVIDFAVTAYTPRDRFVRIRTVVSIVAIQITEAVPKIPERHGEKDHVSPVEQEHDEQRRSKCSQLEVAPEQI